MPKKRPQPGTAPATSELSKYQAFTIQRIDRRAIKNAPYNPRVIDDVAKKRLRENLRTVGLVAPVTVNIRTGKLVGGHQRLSALDVLEGSPDYALDVATVDLDEAMEKSQNVFLNNPSAMGAFDPDAFQRLLDDGLDYAAAGMDVVELEMMGLDLGNLPLAAADAPPEMQAAVKDLQEAADAGKAARQARGGSTMTDDARRQKARMAEEIGDTDTERYAVVVFNSRAEREAFMRRCGTDERDRYVAGARVMSLLKS